MMTDRTELIKRMNATLGMGVISRGSSNHEYAIAESQFKEAAQALRDLERDQADWRKGVELIAAGLGELAPQNLSCVRLHEKAIRLLAEIEKLQARIAELEAYTLRSLVEDETGVFHYIENGVTLCGFDIRASTLVYDSTCVECYEKRTGDDRQN